MPRHIAPVTALILFSALPFAASADTGELRYNRYCELATKDPVAFVQRNDFKRRLNQMAEACPEMALALTDFATGTIQPGKGTNYDGKGFSPKAPDYSDLIARLTEARADVEDATQKVSAARKKLEGTIRRAKSEGISEDDLDGLSPILDNEGDVARLLPSFTAAKRKALEDYVNARDRLAAAQSDLDDANERAEPLVRTALELAGRADLAQGNLTNALGGMSAAERQALLDAAVNAANQALADVNARIAQSRANLDAAIAALNATYNSERYQSAHRRNSEAKDEVDEAMEELTEDVNRMNRLEQAYLDRVRADNSCNSHACRDARNAYNRAVDDALSSKRDYDRKVRAAEETLAALQRVMAELRTLEQQQAIADLTASIIADQAAAAAADQAAQDAARQVRELADLIASTAQALADAAAASEAARAATATEEAEVVAARAALEQALAAAEAALAGSAEEEAALAAVNAAKAELQAALEALGTAQDVAEELAEEVAEINNPPEAVTEPAEALETADEAGDAAAEEAQETIAEADAAVADHTDATEDLSDALDGDTDTGTTSETEATETTPDV